MTNDSTAVDFGINLLEEEIDDVIFRTNEFLTDATFTGGQGPFWWILQMSMALAGLFAIIMCANMAYKMMVKREPLDVMKLFKPLAISIILCCYLIIYGEILLLPFAVWHICFLCGLNGKVIHFSKVFPCRYFLAACLSIQAADI